MICVVACGAPVACGALRSPDGFGSTVAVARGQDGGEAGSSGFVAPLEAGSGSESVSASASRLEGDAVEPMEVLVAAVAVEAAKKQGKHPIVVEFNASARNMATAAGGARVVSTQALASGRIRGLAIYVPGVLGQRARIVQELLDDDWLVATVWPPLVERVLEVFRSAPEADAFKHGVRAAAEVDRAIAEAARLAELQRVALHGLYPVLRESPVLLVCESMGAIAGVGMAATGRISCDAMLLVAGGGGFLEVACESSARRLLFGDLPIDHPRFREGFESTIAFDPLAAAEKLRGAPVVVITAEEDWIVPTHLQERLWRALGEPPRYRWTGGHLELFMRADESVMPVVRAIESRLRTRRAKAAAAEPE